ncbi:MAG: NAD(P)-dependent oxidoreductase [Burkholderiaceae bacterium]
MRVLLTHTSAAFANYFGESALASLEQVAQVKCYDGAEPMDTTTLIQQATDCDIILSDRATPGDTRLFSALPGLRAFLRCAVDIRNVDVDAASAQGVLVTQASPGFVPAVNEWILGAMISLARDFPSASATYHAGGVPSARVGVQLHGSTLGIVGLGSIGSALATLGNHLGMTVLGHDPFAGKKTNVELLNFADLLARSDFVVCLVVANDETENMFNAAAFAYMKRSAYFVNASRGNLVDESALLDVLKSNRIAGAAIDVGRAPDQMPSLEIARQPRVLATPHIGGLTRLAIEHQAFETVRQVAQIVTGKFPAGAVNAQFAKRLGFSG